MKSKCYFVAAVCLLLWACGGCNKEDCPDVYTETPPELAAWFVFPEGSWWAYENDKNDRIDTLWFNLDSSNLVGSSSHESECNEGYLLNVQNFVKNEITPTKLGSIYIETFCGSINKNCGIKFRISRIDRFNSISLGFEFNPSSELFENRDSTNRLSVKNLDSFEVYQDVLKIDSPEFEFPLLLAKNVGLAQFSIDDTLFSLTDYNIE